MKIGDIITLKEIQNARFLITKKTEGGFGIVYFLKSLSNLSDCVMKTFKDKVSLEDIERESVTWAQLGDNENIAVFLCYGVYENKPYILSKRYDSTLENLITTPTDSQRIIEVFKGVVQGLYYANKKASLVHRDIKPANIFLDGSIPKIGDFGLSIFEKPDLFQSFVFVPDSSNCSFGGTISFMAPELLIGRPHFSVTTDIYALGVSFFLFYSNGLLPYNTGNFCLSSSAFEKFNMNCTDDTMKKTILKCIALNPKERFSSYDEIPYVKETTNNQKDTVAEIVNTIQILKRENKIDKALSYAKEKLKQYPKHPLIINQIALMYQQLQDNDKYESTLSSFLNTISERRLIYDSGFYLDPICNLARYYFSNEIIKEFSTLMTRFDSVWKDNKQYLWLYPEYSVFIGTEGLLEESYNLFVDNIINNVMTSKFWLFFCCLCKKLDRYSNYRAIVTKLSDEFVRQLCKATETVDSFDSLIRECRSNFKEFMNVIF